MNKEEIRFWEDIQIKENRERHRKRWRVSLALSDKILYVGVQLIIAADLNILEKTSIYVQTPFIEERTWLNKMSRYASTGPDLHFSLLKLCNFTINFILALE